MARVPRKDIRPVTPNIQIYRPQLTSVLSIAHRVTGIVLSIFAVVLVLWLVAAASGPESYYWFRGLIGSWPGQFLLLAATFAFYLHLCGGIRHLVWDTGRGFQLRQIYASGWAIIVASVVLTIVTWLVSLIAGGSA